MTAPGSTIPPQPGWWPRTDRIGVNFSQYSWHGGACGRHAGLAVGRYGWAGAARGEQFMDLPLALHITAPLNLVNTRPLNVPAALTVRADLALVAAFLLAAGQALTITNPVVLQAIFGVDVPQTVTVTPGLTITVTQHFPYTFPFTLTPG